MPELFDNKTKLLKDDLKTTIQVGSKVAIAASCFSFYAFQELKKQLESIEELQFIFTSPTFISDQPQKEHREFYIPRIDREKSVYGTEFEIRLKNELTQRAIAKECASWVKRKVQFKSNITNENMSGFMTVENTGASYSYMPLAGFTTAELGCERGNNTYTLINKFEAPFSQLYLKTFNTVWNDSKRLEDVTQKVIDTITSVYEENSPEFIYNVTLYNIFHEFLEDISEDVLPNEATGFKQSHIWNKLYNFQQDAVLAIINKLEKFNGCILADSVGLGKTYTALAVIKYYENRNKSVLVLCPKKLTNNWNTFKSNYRNNPIAKDRLRYDVLYHTDLSRSAGDSNGLDLNRLNWGNYDLVVIDESHNFRNGGASTKTGEEEKQNRYLKLLNKVIRAGVKTKVLMLSATPVNNKFTDLRNQLAIAYEGDAERINKQLNTKKGIEEIFSSAQKAFNAWTRLPSEDRTTDSLLTALDFDFFEVLDSVTIARSRKHIQRYYDTTDIGPFPTRLKPISLRPSLTGKPGAINFSEIYEQLMGLNLSIYVPSHFLQPSAVVKYETSADPSKKGISQQGREKGIRHLMSINLLKRLESSVYSFRLTLERISKYIDSTLEIIELHQGGASITENIRDWEDLLDEEDQDTDLFTIGRQFKIALSDMDILSWQRDLQQDKDTLELLISMVRDIHPEDDNKLQSLLSLIQKKVENPINPGNRKILIFSAFSDTAIYLYDNISRYAKNQLHINTALVHGSDGKSTVPRLSSTFDNLLTCFSPISKEKSLLMPNNTDEIDILIGTDCISEGQNLQDCDCVVNYDIHWNPVRIIQRFGRIDRIGSKNSVIQLVNFWPDLELDEYINLKNRVETRMKIVNLTATADDDVLNNEDKADLEYRKKQLERLQHEVVDLEEMNAGISIIDLGLNEFRLDLLSYISSHPHLDRVPNGLHAVVPASKDFPPGVVYILKNLHNEVNIDSQNRLHPFYMVYLDMDGKVICNHLEPKKMLDDLRLLCKGFAIPNGVLCSRFNSETNDGKKMDPYSALLEKTIASIIDIKETSDIDSLFKEGPTTALRGQYAGLDDFELICFFVVR